MKTENTYHVPEESAGVVSICNNWKGINLDILTKDKRHETNLRVGDVVTIKINGNNIAVVQRILEKSTFHPDNKQISPS